MKSPSSVKAFTVATAPPFSVDVGRITEHGGRLLLIETAGLRQDLVGLGELCGRVVEIRKGQPGHRIDNTGQRLRHRVTALIVPQPEVVNFDSADAHQNSQDGWVGCPKGQSRIKTCAALLNKRKVKSRGIGDRLYALGITACDGNCWIGRRRSVGII